MSQQHRDPAKQRRLLEVSAMNARAVLTRIVQHERRLPRPDEMTELISLECELEMKYKIIHVTSFLQIGQEKLSNVRSACTVVRNKFKQLLLPKEDRSLDWSALKASYCRAVPSIGQVLERIGFHLRDDHFVANEAKITTEAVVAFLVDISMIVEELSLYLSGQHPSMETFKSYVSTGGTWQQVQSRIIGLPPRAPAEESPMHPLLIVRASEVPADDGAVISALRRRQTLPPQMQPPPPPPPEPEPEPQQDMLCDLCGDEPVALVCSSEACQRRNLCLNCDQRWHGHPSRRGHKREGANTANLRRAAATLPRPRTLPEGHTAESNLVARRVVTAGKNSVSYKSQLGLSEAATKELVESLKDDEPAAEQKQEQEPGQMQEQGPEERGTQQEAREDHVNQKQEREELLRSENVLKEHLAEQQAREELLRQELEQEELHRQRQEREDHLRRQQEDEDHLRQQQEDEDHIRQQQEDEDHIRQQQELEEHLGQRMPDNAQTSAAGDYPLTNLADDFSLLGDDVYRPPTLAEVEKSGQLRSLDHQRRQEDLSHLSAVEANLDQRQDLLNSYLQSLSLRQQRGPLAGPPAVDTPDVDVEMASEATEAVDPLPPPTLPRPRLPPPPPLPLSDTRRDSPPPPPPLSPMPSPSPSEPAQFISSWTCPNCTANSLRSELKILAPSGRIVCPVCCLTSAPAVDEDGGEYGVGAAVESMTWSCLKCTFQNFGSVDCCGVCDTPRETAKVSVSESRSWQESEARSAALIARLHAADASGAEDVRLVAAALAVNRSRNLSDAEVSSWMVNDWPRLVESVRREASLRYGRAAGFSVGEVAEVLAENPHLLAEDSNVTAIQEVLWVCGKRRDRLVRELQQLNPELDASVLHTAAAKGGLEPALDFLNALVLDRYLGELSEAPAAGCDVAFDSSLFSLHTLMAEYGLKSEAAALRLTRLHNREEFAHYQIEDLVEAVKNTDGVADAASWERAVFEYLNKECNICLERYPRHHFLGMSCCSCEICQECFHRMVTINLKDMHITQLTCPSCRNPTPNDVEQLESHFQHMLAQIGHFNHPHLQFDAKDRDLLEGKLLDWQIMRNPNFVWCSHCASGFELEAEHPLKFRCLQCHNFTCKRCKKPWEKQHNNITCEAFERWKQDNDPAFQARGVAFYLQQHGIECPGCHFKYALAGGGCLHFVCRMCRVNFCSGCGGLFKQTANRGLACDHPRSCLYHLRDFDITRLQTLLGSHLVEFATEPRPDQPPVLECQVMEQKETAEGLVDEACSRRVLPGRANLCDKHYCEYLVTLINKSRLDPVEIMTAEELVTVCRRHGVQVSEGSSEGDLAGLRRVIVARCPLYVPGDE